jgi:hypothetical protein
MRRFVILPLALLLIVGCSSEPYKIAPVSGRVTLNGKPLAKASVTFSPVASKGNDEPGPGSAGRTDADGRYTLKIVGKETKGAVIGKHKVRIALMGEDVDPSDDRPRREKQLPPKYNAETKLDCVVPAGGTDAADFPLTVP